MQYNPITVAEMRYSENITYKIYPLFFLIKRTPHKRLLK